MFPATQSVSGKWNLTAHDRSFRWSRTTAWLLLIFQFSSATAQGVTDTIPVMHELPEQVITINETPTVEKATFPTLSFSNYRHLLKDNFKRQLTFPFRTTRKDRDILLGLGLTATIAFVTDKETNRQLGDLRRHSSFVRVNSPIIGKLGASYSFVVLGLTGAYGFLFKDPKAQTTFLLATQAALSTGVWTHTFKFITSRTRPNAYNRFEGPGHFFRPRKSDDIFWKNEFNSFPSGHTSNAFAIATVFAKMYRDIPAIPIIAYSAASLVGITRIIDNRHWGSDVLMGAALGYFCGSQVVNNYRRMFGLKNQQNNPELPLSFNVNYLNNQTVLGLTYKF